MTKLPYSLYISILDIPFSLQCIYAGIETHVCMTERERMSLADGVHSFLGSEFACRIVGETDSK